jgi:hypothetical protein
MMRLPGARAILERESSVRSFDWTRRVGLAAIDEGGLECAIPDSLPPGTLVTLVWPDTPQRVTSTRILARRDEPWVVAGTPVPGRCYELHAEESVGTAAAYAIAISGEIGAPARGGPRGHVQRRRRAVASRG